MAKKDDNTLSCGHPRDGRPDVSYTSCGEIYCEEDAGAHTCKTGKHSTLPPHQAGGRPKP